MKKSPVSLFCQTHAPNSPHWQIIQSQRSIFRDSFDTDMPAFTGNFYSSPTTLATPIGWNLPLVRPVWPRLLEH